MKIGIVGLGLIGGSFARAYSAAGHEVIALEKDEKVFERALEDQNVTGRMEKDNAGECDLILVCVYPGAAIEFLNEYGPEFGEKPVVMDCCGTKREIVREGRKAAEKYHFTYLGGHPMAGTQYSGYENSTKNMYDGAPMVIVPGENEAEELLSRVRKLLRPVGFASITVTTAEEHDRIIAFTSQLAHVVSNAYVKSPAAKKHKGFSAGSYKDLTRVAWLNPEMWAELFLDNRDYLEDEIRTLISNMEEYRDALEKGDRDELVRLLVDGKRRKEELDG